MDILAALACELGEGARLIGGRLHVVDILRGTVYRWGERGPEIVLTSAEPVGAVAGVAGHADQLVVAEGLGVTVAELERPDRRRRLVDVLGNVDSRATHRVNDAACDPFGRLWVGTMPSGDGGPGAVYRVSDDGAVRTLIDGLRCPNGPAFGADGTVYVADTTARTILTARLDDPGDIAAFVPFVEVAGGLPDGMTVDLDGCLWVAIWGAGQVRRYDPVGRLMTTVAVPASQPTSVCLLDVRGQRSLVITSARVGLVSPTPADGAVLITPVDASAPPANLFGTV